MATGTDKQVISGEEGETTVSQTPVDGRARASDGQTIATDSLIARLPQVVADPDGGMPEDPETTAAANAAATKLLYVLAKGTKPADAQPKSPTENPSMQRFKADYDKLPAGLKEKCPWEVAKARLLGNNGQQLKRAEAMNKGGILFGVDKDGKLLFADKGDEPIMTGMNYKDTRDRVLFKHDHLDKLGKMELDENKKPIPTGYEMFGYEGEYDKSDEILQYELYTGKPFIKSANGKEWRSSWLESGEDPSLPRFINFLSYDGYAYVLRDHPQGGRHDRGVRRLLRV